MVLVVKNTPTNAGDIRVAGSIPGSGRSPGEGNGHPLQYSCPENPMDREAWQAAVHWVAKSRTQLKWQHAHIYFISESGTEPAVSPKYAYIWGFYGTQIVRICLQSGRPGFNLWVRKIPWRRQPAPVFSPCRGAWQATVHEVVSSWTWLSD